MKAMASKVAPGMQWVLLIVLGLFSALRGAASMTSEYDGASRSE